MPRYIIERELPGAGRLTADELRAVARKSNEVLSRLGPEITWHESLVAADRLYCVYTAPSPALIREHARQGGFPADRISEIVTVISPATAESSTDAETWVRAE